MMQLKRLFLSLLSIFMFCLVGPTRSLAQCEVNSQDLPYPDFYLENQKIRLQPSHDYLFICFREGISLERARQFAEHYSFLESPQLTDLYFPFGAARFPFNGSAGDLELLRASLVENPSIAAVYPHYSHDGNSYYVTDQIVFLPQHRSSKDAINQLIAEKELVIEKILKLGPFEQLYVASVAANVNVFALTQELHRNEHIRYAHPDFIMEGSTAYVPNDPSFGSQWFLDQSSDADIDAPEAWDLTTGIPEVVVAVIDGNGYDMSHVDMVGKYVNPYDAVDDDLDPSPENANANHGTPCAGLIAAATDNSIGVASVGFDIKVMPTVIGFNAQSNGSFSTSSSIVAAAAAEIVATPGVVAVSNSIYLSGSTSAYNSSYSSMNSNCRNGKGAVVLASSGNSNSTSPQYPASLTYSVSVGASTSGDFRANFSNYGSTLDCVAPGVSCFTTDRTGADGYSSTAYTNFSGTSAACPVAAGIVGLMASVDTNLTEIQLKEYLLENTDNVQTGTYTYSVTGGKPYGVWNDEMGYGRVNAFQSVQAALGGTPTCECPSGTTQYPAGTLTPTSAWQTISCIYAGEHSVYNVQSGEIYEFSVCAIDGGSTPENVSLNLFDNSGMLLETSCDECGDAPKIIWTSNITGQIKVELFADTTANPCVSNTTCHDVVYRISNPCINTVSSYPYSESFEGSPGLWIQSMDDDLDWVNQTGGTPSNDTGPSFAADGSYYYYTEATGNGTGFPNKVAILESPCFDLTSLTNLSMSFQYHMYGGDMGSLELESSTDGGLTWNPTPLWSLSGDQGNNWLDAIVALNSFAGVTKFKVRFVGTTGLGFESDMAIDNVNFPAAAGCFDPLESNDSPPFATDLGDTTFYQNSGLCLAMGDEDWFRFSYQTDTFYFRVRGFSATSEGDYEINMSISAGMLTLETAPVMGSVTDTYLELYDSTATNLLADDDDGGTGLFSLIQYTFCSPPLEPLVSTSTDSLCPGQTASLTVNNPCGSCTYQWSNGDFGTSISVSTTGTYTVTSTNPCGSETSQNIIISPGAVPGTPIIAGPDTLCQGQTINLQVQTTCSGCTYDWSNGMTGSSIAVSASGNYTVTAINNCGMTTSSVFTVVEKLLPETPIISGNTPVCEGDTITLSVQNICNDCSYSWSNGSVGTTTEVSQSGTYTVTATNSCGMTSESEVVNIFALPAPPVISGSDSICDGTTTTLAVSNPCTNCTYDWSSGETGASITTGAGVYAVMVTDSNGCINSSMDFNVVTVPNPPVPTITQNGFVLTSSAATGNQWYRDGMLIAGATDQTYTATDSAMYSVTVVNEFGCFSSSTSVTTGLEDHLGEGILTVIPNPSSGRYRLEVPVALYGQVQISVFDVKGKIVLRDEKTLSGESYPIDLSTEARGMYVLRVQAAGQFYYQRLIKL